ncbi:MAG: hypothetical protein HY681_13625, partial [Chloroflexi bacterium]|nr:hypothetical protein [Chloroflexota bacterium]
MLTCIGVPNFHAAVRLRRHPSLRPERVVLVDEGLRPPRVVASGQAALAAGVKPGMTVRRAQALCPSAVCLSHDREEAADAFQGIVSVLEMFSPGVEATEPGLAFLDAGPWQGLQKTLEEGNAILAALTLRTGFRAGIGTGQSRFVASTAAEEAGPGRVLVVGPGDEKRFLGPLSVALLPVEGKTLRRLDLLGLRTLGQVRSILREDLIHQFGKEGRLMADLASGIDSTPLSVRREPEPLTASLDFDGPVERGDALLGAALQLLEKLFARLRKRYQLCTRVVLRLHLDDGSTVPITANLATPVGEPELALKALRSRFSTLLLTRPAVGIEVHLEGLGPEQGQQ